MPEERETRAVTPSRRELLLRVAGSVGGGALLVLSFPPYDVVWFAPPALAVMTLSWHGVRARRGAWLGFLAGLAFLLWHLAWMRVIGDDAWVALSSAFALSFALVGAGVAATSRLRVWPLAVPLMWVLAEAVRRPGPARWLPLGPARVRPDLHHPLRPTPPWRERRRSRSPSRSSGPSSRSPGCSDVGLA